MFVKIGKRILNYEDIVSFYCNTHIILDEEGFKFFNKKEKSKYYFDLYVTLRNKTDFKIGDSKEFDSEEEMDKAILEVYEDLFKKLKKLEENPDRKELSKIDLNF